MIDNDIIKALECCKDRRCDICVRQLNHFVDESICRLDLIEHALYLINRLKAEIEKYEKEHNEKFNKWMALDKRTKERYAELYEEAKEVAKTEAIKEFAERLNKQAFYVQETEWEGRVVDCEDINNLVKELTEVVHE